MSYAQYGRGMLDYVQETCSQVKVADYASVPTSDKTVQSLNDRYERDYDGEFIPDPKQVAAVEDATGVRPEYGGELRYVNLGPTKIRNLLETETDPKERAALEHAYKAWQGISPMQFDPDNMGWVDRGEARVANHTTMRDIHANLNPVRWELESLGQLSAVGNGPRVPGQNGEEALGLFEEAAEVLDTGVSASELYFEAGGWTPSCDEDNELDLLLKYDVDEVVSY